jgi:hypothetical protein
MHACTVMVAVTEHNDKRNSSQGKDEKVEPYLVRIDADKFLRLAMTSRHVPMEQEVRLYVCMYVCMYIRMC